MTDSKQTLEALQPYPAYKDSGVEWIGDVPAGWGARRLKQVTIFVGRGESPTYAEDSDVWVINQACVRWGGLDLSRKKFNDPTVRVGKGRLKTNDVLINSTGNVTLGRSTIFEEVPDTICIADNHITIVRTDERQFLPQYLNYLISTPTFQALIYATLVVGATAQIELSRSALLTTFFPVPTMVEQATIATFLDHETARIDELVREQERLLEDLAEQRRSTITAAVTSGIRPRIAQATDIPWLALIPQHWKVIPLKHLAQFQGGMTPPDEPQFWNGNVLWVTPKDMKHPVITDTEDKVTEEAVTNGRLKLFPAGCLLMVVRSGILRHTLPVAVNAADITVNQDMKVLQPIAEVRAKFLYYFFEGLGPSLLPVIQKVGATVESIDMTALRNLQVAVPPLGDQDDIIEHLDHVLVLIDELVKEVQSNIEDMKLLRSTLITAAVTGKVDVRNWRPA